MASLTEIREGLATALRAGVALDMQVSAYILSDPTPPFAQVLPDEIDYHVAMQDGVETWSFIVQVAVATGSDIGSQQLIDQLLESDGENSVKRAIEAATNPGAALEGVIDYGCVTVTKTTGYRTYRFGSAQAEALGAEWTVSVLV